MSTPLPHGEESQPSTAHPLLTRLPDGPEESRGLPLADEDAAVPDYSEAYLRLSEHEIERHQELVRRLAAERETVEAELAGEVGRAHRELRADIAAIRDAAESEAAEVISAARRKAWEILTTATTEAEQRRREARTQAEAQTAEVAERCDDMLAATEADVERRLEWSRAQANIIVSRARGVAAGVSDGKVGLEPALNATAPPRRQMAGAATVDTPQAAHGNIESDRRRLRWLRRPRSQSSPSLQ